jgi:hypothetical protein
MKLRWWVGEEMMMMIIIYYAYLQRHVEAD